MSRWALHNAKVTGLKHLFLLFLIATLVTIWLANGNANSVIAERLFQSPQSPPAEQPAAEEELLPGEQPPAEPAEQPPAEQPPAEQPPAEPAPAEQPATEQLPIAQPDTEIESPQIPTDETRAELSAPEETSPESGRPARERETAGFPDQTTEDRPNFILDQAEFIDTAVVSGAYIWLCCGVSLFLIVPVFMLILYIRGRSKVGDEEDY